MTTVRRLSPTGDLTFGQGLQNLASAAEACQQNVYTRLRLVAGEWFLDLDAGTPYHDEVFVDPLQLGLAEAAIKRTILQTTDVAALTAFSLELDHATRRATILCSVQTVYDTTLTLTISL